MSAVTRAVVDGGVRRGVGLRGIEPVMSGSLMTVVGSKSDLLIELVGSVSAADGIGAGACAGGSAPSGVGIGRPGVVAGTDLVTGGGLANFSDCAPGACDSGDAGFAGNSISIAVCAV